MIHTTNTLSRFHDFKVRLFLGEIKKGGEEFFSKKKIWWRRLFSTKKRGRRLIFRKNKGDGDFFSG